MKKSTRKKLIIGALMAIFLFAAAHYYYKNQVEYPEKTPLTSEDLERLELQVPFDKTIDLRAKFTEEFKTKKTFDLMDFYIGWIDQIGANGIIHSIQTVDPLCHDTAHDLGRLLYKRIQNVGTALLTCEDSCNSGCMHGVLMGFFQGTGVVEDGEDHVDIYKVKDKITTICGDEKVAGAKEMTQTYKNGDCAHGVGHALMYLSDYNIKSSIELCGLFDSYPMDYYCATGAYMEYVTNKDKEDTLAGKPLFHPCQEVDYSAACYRYKMANAVPRFYMNGGNLDQIIKGCLALDEKHRLGCFHGLGNGHYPFVAAGKINLKQLCSAGTKDDQYVCTEGLMERLARYLPEVADAQCKTVRGWQRSLCKRNVKTELYDLEKPFDLYMK